MAKQNKRINQIHPEPGSPGPEPVPEPAALALIAGDGEWSRWFSLTASRGRSQVRMWPVFVVNTVTN